MQTGMTSRIARRIRSEASQLYHKTLASRFVPQHDHPYATHMPVLIGLAQIVRPVRVLELGSGLCSTPLFLNRDAFPSVGSLHSIEDNDIWREKVRLAVGNDRRLKLDLVSSVPQWAEAGDLGIYDLIFVDDSTTIPDRTRTLLAVAARCSPQAAIVVHDFEVRCIVR